MKSLINIGLSVGSIGGYAIACNYLGIGITTETGYVNVAIGFVCLLIGVATE